MKKVFVLSLFVTLFLIGIFFASGSFAKMSDGKDKVDKEIIDSLKTEKSVRVIVIMKNESDAKTKEKVISEAIGQIDTKKVKQKFSSINGFAAKLDSNEINSLEKDANVESIYLDRPVHALLQDSVPLINATKIWQTQIGGLNLTGEGQTVCVIDTGINYSHADFGGCDPVIRSLNGTTENYTLESTHNYTNNFDYTWKVNKSSYSHIAVHFKNLSLECTYDYLDVLDGSGKIIGTYSCLMNDFWTPSVNGSVIYLRLKSDQLVSDYGFYVDEVINGTTNTTYDWNNCSKVIGGWNMFDYGPNPFDDNGHGTHVSGIVSANGSIKGVAPASKIISVKALDSSGNGYSGDIAAGIEWCINKSSEENISVISMSIGSTAYHSNTYCDGDDPVLTNAINSAVAKNISVVVAAGNENNYTAISSPACIQNAIPVGSSTKTPEEISSFSNRNWMVKLFAPGTSINSTTGPCIVGEICNNGYGQLSGTSMATPHVSGAIAIINQYLKLKGMTKTPKEIENILWTTGKNVVDPQNNSQNFSRINVYAAVRSLCTDNLTNTSWQNLGNISLCLTNNTILYNLSRIQYDSNNCGFTQNTTYYATNESSCDSCVPNWTAVQSDSQIWYNDTNNCYAQTNLSSDLLNRPINISLSVEENRTEIFDNESNNSLVIELNFNLSNTSNTLSGLNITKENLDSSFAYMIIRGLNLSENESWIKTVYLDKILSSGLFCLIDSENVGLGNFSNYCNISSSEKRLLCPGSTENYTCSDNGTKFKITGLRNSGIKEIAQFCGDGVCNTSLSETCSSCSIDCGSCPVKQTSSGGGGGGGGATIMTISEQQLQAGLNVKILIGEGRSFVVNNQNHSIQLNNITNNSAYLTVRSESLGFLIYVGQEKKLNLTSDVYYDFSVKLENVTKNTANLTFKKIFEKIILDESTKNGSSQNKTDEMKKTIEENKYRKESYEKYWIAGGLILLVILGVILKRKVFYSQKDKNIDDTKKSKSRRRFSFISRK
ncbi:Subtilisin-like serine protease [uncultured archaeon]|nr:Subtilisin-like serine protease [uncultured archaeon]